MDVPLEIRFHNLKSSPSVEAAIRERVEKLDRLYDRLISCRVAVEAPHRQHRKGNLYEVHVELGVPGGQLTVSREPHRPHEKYASPDVYKALRDAFDAAERQLLDFKRRLNGDVKLHPGEPMQHGAVAAIDPGRDHGFLLTNTGSQLYFHRNSLMTGRLEDLSPGAEVRYIQSDGDTGPTAVKVWPAASPADLA